MFDVLDVGTLSIRGPGDDRQQFVIVSQQAYGHTIGSIGQGACEVVSCDARNACIGVIEYRRQFKGLGPPVGCRDRSGCEPENICRVLSASCRNTTSSGPE